MKKYFWFSEAPLGDSNLTAYISNEKSKDIAHANASHATQTGKGLLFYAKRAEDKDHPQGILNLVSSLHSTIFMVFVSLTRTQADMSDVAKGNFNDFSVSVNGHKYTFQATTKAERDGWLVAIETKLPDAKSSKESIVGSEGYKEKLDKFGKIMSFYQHLSSNAHNHPRQTRLHGCQYNQDSLSVQAKERKGE